MSAATLPPERVRYLMGVGHPHDIVEAVMQGVDLFDCVLPTRAGRHGTAYTRQGRRNLRNSFYRADPKPLDPECSCDACTGFSRGYLHHLVRTHEMLGKKLLTLHNLTYYHGLLARVRAAITSHDASSLDALQQEARRASELAVDL